MFRSTPYLESFQGFKLMMLDNALSDPNDAAIHEIIVIHSSQLNIWSVVLQ